MSVKTYSLKNDGEKQLTKNFKVREFACHDGSDKILIDENLPLLLQEIRDAFGKPITINSAYRNETYNKKVGGAASSQHVKGKAADIVVQDVPPFAIAAWMEQKIKNIGKYACGFYPISLFNHIDVRDNATLFKEYKKSKTSGVSSFGFGTKYVDYLAKEEEGEMTQEKFNEMMENYLSDVAKKAPGNWSVKERTWAENIKLIQGDDDGNKRYKSDITREEVAVIFKRFYDYINNIIK